jgi:hypothetical protein
VRLEDGRVLVTGGSHLVGSFLEDLDTAEVFDPATGVFATLAARMVHTRATHVCLPLEPTRFVLVGGSEVDLAPSLFDALSMTFSPLPGPAQDGARFGAAGASFGNGDASVAGGDDLGTVLHVAWRSAFVQNTGSPLAAPRAYATATAYADDRVLVAGGADTTRGFFLLSSVDLVVAGGLGGSRTYPTSLRFSQPLALHTATRLADGRILYAGGLNAVGGAAELDLAHVFDPAR